ncbi:hypothetical protein R51_16430 [Bacillus safensis]|nr:hypothetical protein R51_16430 [Bacillus safensis]
MKVKKLFYSDRAHKMFTISSNFRRDVTIIEKNSQCSVYIDFSKNGINRLSYISKSPHARLHVGFY